MKVLFVCTGNIFRSAAAEYCLRKYLKENGKGGIKAASAGIDAKLEERLFPELLAYLASLEVDASPHRQRKLELAHLKESDLVVAMAENHQRFIEEKFSHPSYLFNEICYQKRSSVLDLCEAIENWEANWDRSMTYAKKTLLYIHDSMPLFLENASSFLSAKS